jgi:hypothetical protein
MAAKPKAKRNLLSKYMAAAIPPSDIIDPVTAARSPVAK